MDARLREGISLFNDRQFFASHEIWEQFYLATEAENKPFLEGLIQLAAAFRLFSDFGETKGPARMVYQALIRFENYQPVFLQIKVAELCRSAEAWAKAAEAGGGREIMAPLPKITLQQFGLF